MWNKYVFFIVIVFIGAWNVRSQEGESARPVLMGSSQAISTEALSTKDLLPPSGEFKVVNPRDRGSNKIVPGKGYPKNEDAAWQKEFGNRDSKEPVLVFDAATSGSTPTDPTGAVGLNHYVNAWNSSFAIYDKQGNVLSPPASLKSLGGTFRGEDLGDPIVVYDEFADRFLITQFSDTPANESAGALLVAISQGPDPVNDGWYTYRFSTNTFPDYPKIFVWSDGYYVTTNKDALAPQGKDVVFVLERDKMLEGQQAKHLAFPLPGINNNGFYSPAGFFAVGDELPPRGDSPIIYFQDDAWQGVNEDHLKIWLINVDWENPFNSTIEESQELAGAEGVTPFISTFDGGSFLNLSQPGNTPQVDALQGAIMYMTPYRRFPTHNSVVFNFVVDVDASPAEHAGIRWYELRQNPEGGPWRVHQEGTYAPDDSDRWCGSIGIDKHGNIGMGFTVLNDHPYNPVFPSLRYTGRYADDPLGEMTFREGSFVDGESPQPNPAGRYGDYAHLTIDPVDGETFWYIGEYFEGDLRKNRVGVFKLQPTLSNDVGVVDVVSPISSSLGRQEEVTVVIRNFGLLPQTNIPVSLTIDGGTTITDVFTGTIPQKSEVEFTFSTEVNLSNIGQAYLVSTRTNLSGDENPENDEYSETIENLRPTDVGLRIEEPETGILDSEEQVTVIIRNFGGEPQRDIPLSYNLDGGATVSEVFSGTLGPGEEEAYTFGAPANIPGPGMYIINATTGLAGDANRDNDGDSRAFANLDCIPTGSDCSFGDGISSFFLEEIRNEFIYCDNGYGDFIGVTTRLDRTRESFTVAVKTRFASGNREKFSMWIDFNDNASFEEDEQVIRSEVIPRENILHEYEFSLPADAPLGEHILRVRAGDTFYSGNLNNPCSVMEFGTTHDYSVTVVDQISESVLSDAVLTATNRGNNFFDIIMTADYQQTLRITVHDVLGQKLVENQIEKTTDYRYGLDMSYAATGVYLVRVGTREEGKVQRIIVR